ncbi:MAG: hypothetical protein JNL82_18520 [Myxococcales bacterium]|nr:hypothetical protein [Myxococcales bacterium]
MRRNLRPVSVLGLALACACTGNDPTSGAADGPHGAPASTTSAAGPGSTGEASTTGAEATGAGATSGEAAASAGEASAGDTSTGEPGATPTLTRVGPTFEIPTLAETMPKRFADAAHDPVHDVYLVVNGNAAISGTFVDAAGAALGTPLALAETAAWTQGVRVAFGATMFLAAWHDNRDAPDVAKLRGRIVGWDGEPLLAGPDFVIGGDGTYSEMPPAIAWSSASQAFLVVWHTGADHDIHAQRVAGDGALVGGPIAVTQDADWQSDAGVAWHPQRDEWLVVYSHAGATTEVRARRVAGDGALAAPATTLTLAPATWLAQVAYRAETGDYLAAWYEGKMMAMRVSADGEPLGEPFVLAPNYGTYDGFAVARSPVGGGFAAVFHGDSDEDFAAAFTADGAQGPVIVATDSPGADGHFNPRIAAHSTRREWLVVTSLGFSRVVGQVLAE